MKKKITLKKIAKEFEVSISTVSKALKGSHEISEDLREKIKAFADFYHYKPNGLALNLRNQNTKTVGVVIPEIVHHFFSKVISGIEQVANERGYNVMICVSNESHKKEILNMEMLANGVVDGIIVSVSKETEEVGKYDHFRQLLEDGIPLVLFDRVIEGLECNKVVADDEGGAIQATEHLIGIGCKRIAILTTPDHVIVGKKRTEGYLKALKKHGLPVEEVLIVKVDDSYPVEDQITALFNKRNLPDGIFAVNEIYAATALKIANSRSIKVPEDLAIIGFTDGLISEFTTPPLSTVAQHGFHMGAKALNLLLDEIESKDNEFKYRTEVIRTDLRLRESTRKKEAVKPFRKFENDFFY